MSADGVACGYSFKEGQEYLVYADGKGEPFETVVQRDHATFQGG